MASLFEPVKACRGCEIIKPPLSRGVCFKVRPLIPVILVDGDAINAVLCPKRPIGFLICTYFDLEVDMITILKECSAILIGSD